MRTRYNYGGKYSYGGRYKNGGALNALMKKYEDGGPVIIEDTSDLLSALNAVDVPEDYTEQEIIDVRGAAKFGGNEGFKKRYGYALDEDENVAQPREFRVITERGKRPGQSNLGSGRGYVDFNIENVELGGINEKTGDTIANTITIPAEIYDMIEEGDISMNDLTGAMSPYYSRSQQAGVRTRPYIVRGADPEEEEEGRKGNPPRNRGRNFKFKLPEIKFPQGPAFVKPRYGNNKTRPLFTKGQHGRIGRGS